jgi:hypothetical protein
MLRAVSSPKDRREKSIKDCLISWRYLKISSI